MTQLRRAGKLELDINVQVFPVDEVIGESTGAAVRAAEAWLGQRRADASK